MVTRATPSVFDVQLGTQRVSQIPTKTERFSVEQVKDPNVLSSQLSRLSEGVADVTLAMRANPLGVPTVYTGIVCGTGGAKVILRHGRGRRVFWWVVGWSGAGVTAAPILVCDELDASGVLTDDSTLALRSYAAGTLALAVT